MNASAPKKTILIIEDEEVFLRPLRAKLIAEGFAVLAAHDGAEGLELARQEKPDMILLDLKMPRMDGMTMLRALRETETGKAVPVLILTVLSINDDTRIREVAELTPIYYLEKGETPLTEVIEKIREVLS